MLRCEHCSVELDETGGKEHSCVAAPAALPVNGPPPERPVRIVTRPASTLGARAAAVYEEGGRSDATSVAQRPMTPERLLDLRRLGAVVKRAERVLKRDLVMMSVEQRGLVIAYLWSLLDDDAGSRADGGVGEQIGILLGMKPGAVRQAKRRAIQAFGEAAACAQGQVLLEPVFIHVRNAIGLRGLRAILESGGDWREALSMVDDDCPEPESDRSG